MISESSLFKENHISTSHFQYMYDADLTGHVYLLPCSIKHDGPSPVFRYFKPRKIGVVVEGLSVEEAFFRERKLQGVTVPLPEGYYGYVLEKNNLRKGKRADTSDGVSSNWKSRAEFGNLTCWNHDTLPSSDDPLSCNFHWFSVADASSPLLSSPLSSPKKSLPLRCSVGADVLARRPHPIRASTHLLSSVGAPDPSPATAKENFCFSSDGSVSFAYAKRLMRLVNVEALKTKLGREEEEVIGYTDLLEAAESMGVARSREVAFARVFDGAGVILLFRDKVYLHQDKLSKDPDWPFMKKKDQIAFLFGTDDHWGPLSVFEVNILVVSKYYSRITLKKVADLLCLSQQVLIEAPEERQKLQSSLNGSDGPQNGNYKLYDIADGGFVIWPKYRLQNM